MLKKKLLSMAMACALLAGALTGCGKSASAATKTADGRTEIEFWYSGGKTAVNVVTEIIDAYNASQDKYTVKAVTQADYDETYEKLQAGIAGKAAPDVVLLEAAAARSLSDKKLVVDLSSMINSDSSFYKDDYLEAFYKQGVDDSGKVYALPAYGTTQVMYYNKAVFAAAGIEASSIQTWQDIAAAAKKIKESGSATYGWEPMWDAKNLIDASLSNGASIFSADKKTVTINSNEWVEVWDAFRTWIHTDKTMAIHSGGQGWEYWYKTMDDAIAGTAGGYTGSSGDQADLDFNIVSAMEQPAWDNDSKSAPLARELALSAISQSGQEEKQGAYDFMRYFSNAESQTKWTMATGYVPVNKNVYDNTEYQAYTAEHPQALIPLSQSEHASVYPYDPTNGAILDALMIAADKIEIDGTSAKEALDEAQKTAQAALDEALSK